MPRSVIVLYVITSHFIFFYLDIWGVTHVCQSALDVEFQNAHKWWWWFTCFDFFAWGQQFSGSQGISSEKKKKKLKNNPPMSLLLAAKTMIYVAIMYDMPIIFGCQESSVIHSNVNLGIHGQGLLNLSGPGNLIEAQRLILSLFYSINVRQSLLMLSLG